MINDFSGIKPNAEAESAVIGAILVDPDKIMPEVETILTESDFLVSEYRTLFHTCSGYFVDGKPIDSVILIAQLGEEYKPVLASCIRAMPYLKNWQAYAKIVSDTAKRYRAFEAVNELANSLVFGTEVEECREKALKISELLNSERKSNVFSAKEGFLKFYISLQKPAEYIKTGFSKLDKYAFISPGDFVVIGARPSVGKTALTLQMLLTMSKAHNVAYFSLETGSNNLFGRMSANLSRESLRAIKTRKNLDYRKIAELKEDFDNLNFHCIEAAGWTVAQIKAQAMQLGADIIFIDYMGLIKAEGSGRYEKMTNISIDLHILAQQTGKTVIALSQLSREGKHEPTMESLRESGQIEQDADIIMLLHNSDEDEFMQMRELRIAKNKEGEVGDISLAFDGDHQLFTEILTVRDKENTEE